jgi:hypothetical protein
MEPIEIGSSVFDACAFLPVGVVGMTNAATNSRERISVMEYRRS